MVLFINDCYSYRTRKGVPYYILEVVDITQDQVKRRQDLLAIINSTEIKNPIEDMKEAIKAHSEYKKDTLGKRLYKVNERIHAGTVIEKIPDDAVEVDGVIEL